MQAMHGQQGWVLSRAQTALGVCTLQPLLPAKTSSAVHLGMEHVLLRLYAHAALQSQAANTP